MVNLVPTGLAVSTLVLFAGALLALAAGRLTVAGMCFLSASIVIYFRETRLQDQTG